MEIERSGVIEAEIQHGGTPTLVPFIAQIQIQLVNNNNTNSEASYPLVFSVLFGQGLWVYGNWSPFNTSTGIWYFFCHNSGIVSCFSWILDIQFININKLFIFRYFVILWGKNPWLSLYFAIRSLGSLRSRAKYTV